MSVVGHESEAWLGDRQASVEQRPVLKCPRDRVSLVHVTSQPPLVLPLHSFRVSFTILLLTLLLP